jgi:Rps23 Pro-64 3,4-dihydroxylase Tpa1-like proline 4-hydroxylase
MRFSFNDVAGSGAPFPHLRIKNILSRDDADLTLRWFKRGAPWKLTVAEFYEQYEFSLLDAALAPEVHFLVDNKLVSAIAAELKKSFKVEGELELVEVSAHKLTHGQTIRIHNDYVETKESHRLLIQINDGWETSQGGLLMLFSSPAPESVQNVLLPIHGSGFAFEISPKSFHAVSSIISGERYTLVYTFRRFM